MSPEERDALNARPAATRVNCYELPHAKIPSTLPRRCAFLQCRRVLLPSVKAYCSAACEAAARGGDA